MQRTFDLPFMTKLSIGPSWGRLTPEQKQSAARAFGRYVTATYATRFDGFSGETWPTAIMSGVYTERTSPADVLENTDSPDGFTVEVPLP